MSTHTPRQSNAPSSSRYSTPLQHHAVSRLRGNRASNTPPSQQSSTASSSSSHSQEHLQYSTPRSSRTSYSSQGHGGEELGRVPTPHTPRTPIQGTPSRRKGAVRIVKAHKPWYERLAKLPVELWDRYELQLNEFILTDLEKLEDLAYPAAFATLTLHFFLRVIVGASSAFASTRRYGDSASRTTSKVSKYANSAEARLEELRLSTQGRIASWGGVKILIYRCATLLCWILVLTSLANAFWLFSKRRNYRLFMQDNTINSPNSKIVRLNTTVQTDTGCPDDSDEEASKPSYASRIYQIVRRMIQSRHTNRRPQDVQELSVWTPSTFALRFFAIYSPPISLLIQFTDRSNFLTFFTAAVLLSLQTYFIIHSFTQMMVDRQTVNSEVMHEYNAKFVAPRVFYARKDASTMTNEAEMIDIGAYKRAARSNSRRSPEIVGIQVPYY